MKQTVEPAWINMPGETSFCTTTPAIGERTASSVRMAVPCCSAWSISCAGDAEDLERLQAVLDVGRGVVVIRLAALVILGRDRAAVQQLLHAVHDALGQDFAVARLAVGGNGVGHIGAGDIQQGIARGHARSGIHQDAGNRAVHLGDGLGGVVRVPIHRSGGANGDHPGGSPDRHDAQVRELVLGHRKQGWVRGLGGIRPARPVPSTFFNPPQAA